MRDGRVRRISGRKQHCYRENSKYSTGLTTDYLFSYLSIIYCSSSAKLLWVSKEEVHRSAPWGG